MPPHTLECGKQTGVRNGWPKVWDTQLKNKQKGEGERGAWCTAESCSRPRVLPSQAKKILKPPHITLFSISWTNKCWKYVYLFCFSSENSFQNVYIRRGCIDLSQHSRQGKMWRWGEERCGTDTWAETGFGNGGPCLGRGIPSPTCWLLEQTCCQDKFSLDSRVYRMCWPCLANTAVSSPHKQFCFCESGYKQQKMLG